MDPIIQKFREKFFDEAGRLLDQLEKDLLELEKDLSNKELKESAFRAMHTIKGVSGMYGFDFICEFTHSIENLYQALRENKLNVERNFFDISFSAIDHIRKLLVDEKLNDPTNQKNHHDLINQVNQIVQTAPPKPEPTIQKEEATTNENTEKASTWHILLRTDEKMYFRGISLLNIFRELATIGEFQISRLDFMSQTESDTWSIILTSKASQDEITDIFLFIEDNCSITQLSLEDVNGIFAHQNTEAQEESTDHEISIIEYIENQNNQTNQPKKEISSEVKEQKAVKQKEAIERKRISVDSQKLDQLMYLVSELITVNSQLEQSTKEVTFNSIRGFLEKVDNLSKQFRNNALEIRLVPLSDTILRFQRLIRDLSKQMHKKINLETSGIDTELDKSTIDNLNDPLMHIIRNCIDHGIETPEQRMAKGKPETGTIAISAYHSGNYIYIKIADDGSGIDAEKVRKKAIDKGIWKADYQPTRKEIFDLIFLPGFSTAQSLTEISGRGVGMDVVRKKIQNLRGDVEVESEQGKGTAFILKLQQSVTIIDTLLFTVNESNFIIPISDIQICSQYSLNEINLRRHTATLPYNNRLIPFIDMRQWF
ncbi:MAG TPA: chemotaxis protein CheA, partial [Bacteroidales bacterium]|nr:chemotaxis protein CheA [Bacteroidales bacterium]